MSYPGQDYGQPARQRSPWWTAALWSGGFVALLFAIEAVDTVLGNQLDYQGVKPRDQDGLVGILFAPLLHGGWGHLLANAGPLLVLGFLILLSGVLRWAMVTMVVWVVGGVGIWVTGAPNSVHIGASILVFGWLVYLILRGIFSRRLGQIAVGLVVLVLYGGALWGVLPGQAGVSWEGHLFGAIGGGLAAWWLAPEPHRRRTSSAR
ncbi:rhomboid family intramembrane serine protease [Nocardioides sp.]|uniref:rhomboid family intramembrane serine protease n=1 Tax=Nocardioides sp. TaxID=35761 RepID=UPI002734385F|nr:rhomboid family intramembrane serine protease [Nocardioides sp.]MDP3891725.1 rhomboid family intramembrane serine protease [Nocardioides sp.]